MARKSNFEIAFELGARMDPSVKKAFESANQRISNFGKGLGTVVKQGAKMAAGLGVALAGTTVALGASAVKASADAQAMNAQFEQVFGDIQKNAQATIDKMGKDFGMVSNRIKPAMSQMTSMFKGLGMDTESAMKQAEMAVTLTADAAAFYDKSFEDANAALNSFIKGNYEGGESIGLFANETQMASWASKNLSLDWKSLDEAGKQVARLEYAKAMQEAAGATGQASRESDSLENQMGNLRQVWQDLQAKLGESVLPIVIDNIKGLSNWLQNVDTETISTGIKKVADKAKEMAVIFKDQWLPAIRDGIAVAIEKAKDLYNFFANNWTMIKPTLMGIVVGLVAFKAAMVAMSIVGGVTKLIGGFKTSLDLARTSMSGLNKVMKGNVFILIATVAIPALIAAGMWLIKNWDQVKIFFVNLWSAIKSGAVTVGTAISNAFTTAYNWVIGVFAGIGTWFSERFLIIQNAVTIVGQWIGDQFQTAYDRVTGLFGGIGEWFSGVWDGVVGVFKSGLNFMIGIANSAIEKINGISIKVPDWVPKIGGKDFGFNIPQIPMLAQGGITTGPTLAMIGEGAEQEAVLPLSKLQALLDAPERGNAVPSIQYNPTVIVQGDASRSDIQSALANDRKNFEMLMEEYLRKKRRVSLN